MKILTTQRPFRYLADPICIGALALYALGRFVLKPHHLGGPFVHDYLNDLLCLPLFLPIILRVQTLLRLRHHDHYPRLWEILQHWLIFSVIFELILPRFPHIWTTTADPKDALAYLAGGLLAASYWCYAAHRPAHPAPAPLQAPTPLARVRGAARPTPHAPLLHCLANHARTTNT